MTIKEKDGTMRFHFETMPLTGLTDVMSVQAIGMTGDNRFVIEAETEDEARKKLLDLLEKRVWQGRVVRACVAGGHACDESVCVASVHR